MLVYISYICRFHHTLGQDDDDDHYCLTTISISFSLQYAIIHSGMEIAWQRTSTDENKRLVGVAHIT